MSTYFILILLFQVHVGLLRSLDGIGGFELVGGEVATLVGFAGLVGFVPGGGLIGYGSTHPDIIMNDIKIIKPFTKYAFFINYTPHYNNVELFYTYSLPNINVMAVI